MADFWKKPEAWLSVVIGGATIVLAIAAIIVTVQVGTVSGLSDDVRSTASRIDQIYPTLVSQAGDIGAIKGSLEVSAQKISAVSDSLGSLAARLEAAVVAQEAQAKNLDGAVAAIDRLTGAVAANQAKLDSIAADVKVIREASLLKKSGFATVVALGRVSPEVYKGLVESGTKVLTVGESKDAIANAVSAAITTGPQFQDVWLATDDPKTGMAWDQMFQSIQEQ